MQLDNLVPYPFYQRLNRREKFLVVLVAGTAFILGNMMALTTVTRSFKTLRSDYAQKRDEWDLARHFLEDKPTWDARAAWVAKQQEPLINRDTSNYQLLDQLPALGRKHGVIVTNQKIIPLPPAAKPNADYQTVTLEIDTRSDWGALVRFIHAVQEQPEKFLAFDEARLRTEQSDPATIVGNFRISKWYKPPGK